MVMPTFSNPGDNEICETHSITCDVTYEYCIKSLIFLSVHMVIGKKQELVLQITINSIIHKVALEATITIPYNYQDVSELLSSEYTKRKVLARDCLFEIASGIRFLVRQGLPLRGHNDEENSTSNN